MLELLSPAGTVASLKAAVSGGADAVYFGASKYNARINADNFQQQDIVDSIAYCHKRGVKCHAVLNTLVLDKEFSEAVDLAEFFVSSGIDALIVQDVGLANEIRKRSNVPLHASTQMTVHSSDGVKLLEQMGFTRAVLSRELSKEDIVSIRQNISPEFELEIFVHGALCFSYSGQCYMSSIIGGRSGNRGCCAQPCRLPYENGYSLSLKDLCMLNEIPALKEIGVDSLKIEGRMKSPEYVYYVTKAYADALRGTAPTERDIKELSEIFSRNGFTNGYFDNKTGPTMFGTKQNNSDRTINPVPNTEYIRHSLDIECSFDDAKEDLIVSFIDENKNKSTSRVHLEKANTVSLTQEKIKTSLGKLGNTVYSLRSIDIDDIPPGYFASAASLNEARRHCLSELEECLSSKPYSFRKSPLMYDRAGHSYKGNKKLRAFFNDISKVPLKNDLLDKIILRLEDIKDPMFKVVDKRDHDKIVLSIPSICHDTEYPLLKELVDFAKKEFDIKEFLINNIGFVHYFQDDKDVVLHGDYGLNVFNSFSRDLFLKKVNDVVLSFELPHGYAEDLCRKNCGIIAYGRLPFMIFKNCIKKKHKEYEFLKDRKNKQFLLSCEFGCRNRLYNSDVLWIADKDLSTYDFIQLIFTDEKKEDVENIIKQYASGTGSMLPGYTRGRYY